MAFLDDLPDEYKYARLAAKEDGAILADDKQIASTIMCRHCQQHFMVRVGSGIKRGWCHRCGGPTCGRPECETRCYPFEKWLDDVERQATREARLGI